MKYGDTREEAISQAEALALRGAHADRRGYRRETRYRTDSEASRHLGSPPAEPGPA